MSHTERKNLFPFTKTFYSVVLDRGIGYLTLLREQEQYSQPLMLANVSLLASNSKRPTMGQAYSAYANSITKQQSQDCKDPIVEKSTDNLIKERGKVYGHFADGALIMRGLKEQMHKAPGWNSLRPEQKEALDMIQHKIGRILNGNTDYPDSWADIAGYASLVDKILRGENP